MLLLYVLSLLPKFYFLLFLQINYQLTVIYLILCILIASYMQSCTNKIGVVDIVNKSSGGVLSIEDHYYKFVNSFPAAIKILRHMVLTVSM